VELIFAAFHCIFICTAFSFADNLCPEISVITTESKNILLRHFYQKSEEKVRLPLRFSSEVKYCVIYA
jgi:hypothetical protein